MKIFLSLFIVFFTSSVIAECTLKSEIVSLSGTTTVILQQMGLLNHPNLKGISVFNPVQNFKGKTYPGGIFLSHGTFSDMKGMTVLYDESRDLRKILETQVIRAQEIKTRNLTPFEAMENGIAGLKDLVAGCEEKIKQLRARSESLKKEILKNLKDHTLAVFYLGEFRNGRAPELLMVNDGVVKWLISEKKIRTYPSPLAYVNWSSKIMNSLPKDTLHVGIKDSGNTLEKKVSKKSGVITLVYPGSLVPGLSQLEAFLYLVNHL